jgi:hypothetical protein
MGSISPQNSTFTLFFCEKIIKNTWRPLNDIFNPAFLRQTSPFSRQIALLSFFKTTRLAQKTLR